jgi:hypothetical protein
LIERCAGALEDAAVVDRRLQDLEEADRRLLAYIGHSSQPEWQLGNLLEILAALGSNEGPQQVFRLFEAGLLYPVLSLDIENPIAAQNSNVRAVRTRLRSFTEWLRRGTDTRFAVFTPPQVARRAIGCDLGLPECPSQTLAAPAIHEADGLEWPLRLAALCQQLAETPLRSRQSGEFFKRDLDRLSESAALSAPPADNLAELVDQPLFAVALARAAAIVVEDDTGLRPTPIPAAWDEGLEPLLAALWQSLPFVDSWNARQGWCGKPVGSNPYPSAYLLSLMLISRLPHDGWAKPSDIEDWVLSNHPFWREDRRRPAKDRGWIGTFLLGLAYHLRLLQAAKGPQSEWLVRLSPLGRWMLGLAEQPPDHMPHSQTLLVQPNHEIIVYRQGLSPGLIARLSRFAAWKSMGAACTLELHAGQVYRALESGLTIDAIVQTLEQHCAHRIPGSLIQSLRTWADKRERITVYPSATLFEFGSAEDLNDALARGVPGARLSERLLAVADESGVDFRHFRLTGTRDYGLPPEKCVEIDPDGVTLAVDVSKSDLLLESELPRFAEPLDGATVDGRRRYRLTPASLKAAMDSGFGLRELEDWFLERAGRPPSPAALLIQGARQISPFQVRAHIVLHVPDEELADGLEQWPCTRPFVKERLGPKALAIEEEKAKALQERLESIGITLQFIQPARGGDESNSFS